MFYSMSRCVGFTIDFRFLVPSANSIPPNPETKGSYSEKSTVLELLVVVKIHSSYSDKSIKSPRGGQNKQLI